MAIKTLLVEDEVDIARLIVYVLETEGFDMDCVYDAAQAEKKIHEQDYDLLLLDLMLPGEDGYSFLRRLKEKEEIGTLPVIIISARALPEEVERGLDYGACGYITKPYNPLTLAREIRSFLAQCPGC